MKKKKCSVVVARTSRRARKGRGCGRHDGSHFDDFDLRESAMDGSSVHDGSVPRDSQKKRMVAESQDKRDKPVGAFFQMETR